MMHEEAEDVPSSDSYHNRSAHRIYSDLVGEEFEGSCRGYRRVQSKLWLLIYITKCMNEKLEKGLENIRSNFEGRIWKGMVNNTLYVESRASLRILQKSSRFKIVGYMSFPITVKGGTYKDKEGFSFQVMPVC